MDKLVLDESKAVLVEEELPAVEITGPIGVEKDADVPEVTEEDKENAFYGLVSDLLRSKFDEIDQINSIITTITYESGDEDIVEILKEIADEDSIHLGMYQKVLEIIKPEASKTMDAGVDKAEEIIGE